MMNMLVIKDNSHRIHLWFISPVSSKKPIAETSKLAECIGETQDLLRKILAEEVRPSKVRIFLSEPPGQAESMPFEEEVLSEAHRTFRSCFHAFYPTGPLKWWCLCDLLSQMEPVSNTY